GEQVNQGASQLVNLSEQLSQGRGFSETHGESKTAGLVQSFQNVTDTLNQISKEHGISAEKALSLSLAGNAGVKLPSQADSSIFSLGLSTTGNGNLSASDRDMQQKLTKSGQTQTITDNLNEGLSFLQDMKASNTSNQATQMLDQVSASFNKAKTYSEQAQTSLNESQAWSQQASSSRQKGLQSDSNINDQVLSQIAQAKFGGDTQAAARWQAASHQQ
ncbi:MAG: hypothetical protein IM607_17485, partial [Cytophagales bacterium]|nr:hypothetical protein [Cytophagales bacterium]